MFEPRNLSVALSTDTAAPGTSCAAAAWGAAFCGPPSYACHSASYQEMKCGGCVAYFVLENEPSSGAAAGAGSAGPASPRPAKARAPGAGSDAGAGSSDGGSPRGVLKHFPSFSGAASLRSASVAADLDLLGSDGCSDNSSVRWCGGGAWAGVLGAWACLQGSLPGVSEASPCHIEPPPCPLLPPLHCRCATAC